MTTFANALVVMITLLASTAAVGQQKRIFFFEAGNSISIDSAKDAITSVFKGEVVSATVLPIDLSGYDLIYVYGNSSQNSQIQLVEHLKSGGRVFLDMWMSSDADDGDSLFNYLHLQVYGLLTAVKSEGVGGVIGTFAEGFVLKDPTYTGFMSNLDQTQDAPGAEMQLVLQADGPSDLAWVREDDGSRILIFLPQAKYYYKPFISHAICNYFELCVLNVDQDPSAALSISFDPINNALRLPAPGSITISDILGRVIMTRDIEYTTYSLPTTLAKGSYTVRWQSSTARASTTISVF